LVQRARVALIAIATSLYDIASVNQKGWGEMTVSRVFMLLTCRWGQLIEDFWVAERFLFGLLAY